MTVLDDLVRLLGDRDVGLWCKRAAWVVVLIDALLLVFNLLGILVHGDPASLPTAFLTTMLGALASALWQFFVLYALGAVVTSLVRP
jgi:hypothetical protein